MMPKVLYTPAVSHFHKVDYVVKKIVGAFVGIHQSAVFFIYRGPRFSSFIEWINMRMMEPSTISQYEREVDGVKNNDKKCGG